MLPPSAKRKLRDIHSEITMIVAEMCGTAVNGDPMPAEKMRGLIEKLDKQNKRIYGILDPPYRRSK